MKMRYLIISFFLCATLVSCQKEEIAVENNIKINKSVKKNNADKANLKADSAGGTTVIRYGELDT
jgi:hypothetical protein